MNMTEALNPEQSELGKQSTYHPFYNPDLLFPILRKKNRDRLNIQSDILPFYGFDYWNHYEVSWLNEKGKPVVALAEIIYDCASHYIIESKSMKLYFNSFNNTSFKDVTSVENLIKKDLAERLHCSTLSVRIILLNQFVEQVIVPAFQGLSLDNLDIVCDTYHTQENFLTTESPVVEETLYSDLLKSNCLITHQPDWCSVQIRYKGKQINHAGLLKYIVSFRNDNEFHEHCIEKIFMHLMKHCTPQELTVYGRSTRRGGIDINSFRSTKLIPLQEIKNVRLCRQ